MGFAEEISSLWDKVTALTDDAKAKYKEALSNMDKLAKKQAEVDAALSKMPDGPEKTELLQKRTESRGIFENYVVPAWNQLKTEMQSPMSGPFGIAPLVPIIIGTSIIAICTTIIYWTNRSYDMEEEMLKNPALAKVRYQTQSGIAGGLQMVAVAGIAVTAIWFATKLILREK